MTEHEIRRLLAACMAYDNRREPGAANVAAWQEAATRAHWTFDAALDAIHDHYAETPEFCMPGHVTKRLRGKQGLPPRYVALPPAEPASEETRNRIMRMIGNKFGMPRTES